MTGLISAAQVRVRAAARATAFSIMGVVFWFVGLGFLTVALWIVLAAFESPLVAYTAIGALYVILGFVLMAVGAQTGRSPEQHQHEAPQQRSPRPEASEAEKDPIVRMAEGFAAGMQAGRNMRHRNGQS